jgi:hypothetical protein
VPNAGIPQGGKPMSNSNNDWLSMGALCVVILASLAFFFSQVATYTS